MSSIQHPFIACCETIDTSKIDMGKVRPANRDLIRLICFQGLSDPRFSFFHSFKLNLDEMHLACGFKCTPRN